MSRNSDTGVAFDEAITEEQSQEFKGVNVYDPTYKDADGTLLLPLFAHHVTKAEIRGIQTMVIPAHVRDQHLSIGQECVLVQGKGSEPEKWYIIWNPTKSNSCAFGEGWYGYVQANNLNVDDMVEFYKNENTGV
ncbi:hypothetical protein RIF29_14363 [Crotalaria pallida]|uniref:TF-B3 domain-containing protein n=1 Tax=Crotalaria pallida TaxID=3830 RepID=A0AAN9FBJ9_CROPI